MKCGHSLSRFGPCEKLSLFTICVCVSQPQIIIIIVIMIINIVIIIVVIMIISEQVCVREPAPDQAGRGHLSGLGCTIVHLGCTAHLGCNAVHL